jgi:hypothetical protein
LLPPTRRERLQGRRRLRQRTVVIVVIAVLLVGGIGTAVALTMNDTSATDSTTSTASDRASTTLTSQPSPIVNRLTGELNELPEGRPLSHEDPLRLWIGGDSLAGGIGPVVGQYAEDSGVVRGLVDFKVSSGLAARVRDWPEYAADLIDEFDPEAIVFMIGANDANIVSNDVTQWEPGYREKVREMMDLLVGGTRHRTVFWIGSPPMRLEDREEGIVELNRVFQEEALLRPDVIYVDAYTMFEGPEGGYSSSIVIPGRGRVYVRVGDGVHFTGAGAEWLGYNVWRLIDQRWEVGTYEQPDLPIDFETEPGGNTGCCDEPPEVTDPTDPPADTTTTTLPCPTDGTCETTTTIEGETTTTTPETTTAPTSTVPPTTTTSPTTTT